MTIRLYFYIKGFLSKPLHSIFIGYVLKLFSASTTYLFLLCPQPVIRRSVNPYPTKLIYLNFKALEVVSRYRDPQPQVLEKYSYLFNLRPTVCKS